MSRVGSVSFQAHVDLLRSFLVQRDDIVERIQTLLNAQRKPTAYLQDTPLLARHFEDCFFTDDAAPGTSVSQLRGQLEQAHWATGFKPRDIPGLHNGAADPAEMMARAFYMWRQTRWPGRNGRVRYAHTLFNLYIVRCLELLSMRIWDEGHPHAGGRLAQIQELLDQLWNIKTADQPVLVSDARWLIQTAQSLATDDLSAYFAVAERITQSLTPEDRMEIHKASVRMTAGHLRSQIRYHSTKKAASLDEESVVLSTRDSNALDFALLIQDLVPLLDAYEAASQRGDDQERIELADAICQGISPDPELFVNRVELLGAYSMLEPLFVTSDLGGQAVYTPMGRRHVRLVEEYTARIGRVATALSDDCPRFRPIAGAYSPYGVLYGFSADLVKHMVLKASQPDAAIQFRLEDVFVAADPAGDKLAWVNGWRKLPHLTREMEKQFEYPHQFANAIFDRIEQALRRRASGGATNPQNGRLFIVTADHPQVSNAAMIPDLPVRYVRSSDEQLVAAHGAEPYDAMQLLKDRAEGKFIVSYETAHGWVGLTKTILTQVLGTGHDAKIARLPEAAAGTLMLMCPHLIGSI